MRNLIIAAGLSVSGVAAAADKVCSKNPIYCKIMQYKKTADKTWAMEFSNKLVKKAKEHRIDPNLALAILLQESMLENVNTFKTETIVENSCDERNCYKITTTTEKAFDLSIAQININTARHYKFDIERLFLLDQDYAIECFFIILEDKLKLCSYLGEQAYTCYHSANEPYRTTYHELIQRYLQ
jgi:hypothetical protein